MALTLSGTNGVVGAGFTLDASGASVTAGVGTFGSLNAPAAGLTGALPAISAASLTQIPAANIVGVCTAGLANASGVLAGVTMVDQWRITSSATGNQAPIQNNLERVDTAGYGVLGNGMSVSSGIWTFPATGIYRIDFQLHGSINSSNIAYLTHVIYTTTNNSSYSTASHASPSAAGISATIQYINGYCSYIFDVVDTSTHKVKFHIDMSNTAATTTGSSSITYTGFWFTRLGDT